MLTMLQSLVVDVVVACSLVYATWALSPKALRSRIATAVLKLPRPRWLDKPLQAAIRQQGGCGCDGCDRSAAMVPEQGTRPMVFQPRVKK